MGLEFLRVLEEAVSGFEEDLEIRVWRRGLGIPPGVPVTPGLAKAGKKSIIPAIIVNGKLVFGRDPPKREELRRVIEEALGK